MRSSADDSGRGGKLSFSHLLWKCGIIASQGLGALVGDEGMFGAHVMYGHIAVIAGARVLRDRDPGGEQAVQDADGDQVVVARPRSSAGSAAAPGRRPVPGGRWAGRARSGAPDPGGLAVFPQRPEA